MSTMSQSNLPATLSPPSQGSVGMDSGASGSSGSSFQQRRKRSESIGGIKSTAGNITRIVRKSSSNFLRKLVKNFDDKDAPPIPIIPSNKSTSSSHNITPPASVASRTTTMPELPTLSSYGSGFGPLDAAPISSLTSDINAQMGENGLINSRPMSMHLHESSTTTLSSTTSKATLQPNELELDLELSQSVSNVESWLNTAGLGLTSPTLSSSPRPLLRTTSSPESSTINRNSRSSVTPLTSAALTGTVTPLTSHSDISHDRRDSHSSGSTDDDDEDEEDEDGTPLAAHSRGSNRISRLYETGSIHLGNQSQTSLYYSTKSTVSDEADNNAIAASKRASMAQEVAFNRNSIRFSEYGISSIKDLPSTPSSTASFDITPGASGPDKPLPKRPTSMFVSMSTPTSITTDHEDEDVEHDGPTLLVESEDVNDISLRTPVSSAQTSPASERALLSGLSTPKGAGATLGEDLAKTVVFSSTRPATICVSPEDAVKISTLSTTAALTSDMSPAEQHEAMDSLALRTSKRCYREDESFLPKDEISCYLGTPKPFNRLVLIYYMTNFDFGGKRLDFAFRSLCQKLVLKGETQEVDRVLEAFAQRYVDCNPQHLLGTKDVVHAITYSILLLNTDLHIVQQSTKMSRSAFVKNTLQTVQAQIQSSERPSEDLGSSHGLSLTRTGTGELSVNGAGGKKRTPSVKSWKSGQSHQSRSSKMGADPKANGGHGNGKYWMNELESLLKDIYSTVKSHQILLPTSHPQPPLTPTSSSFSSHKSSPGSNHIIGGSGGFLPRMSRQVHPNSLSEAGFGPGHLGNDNSRTGSGGSINVMPSFGMARRNSNSQANARTKQLRQEAMQRLNAAGTIEGGTYLTPGPSSNASHRYSVIGAIGDAYMLGGANISPAIIDRKEPSSRFSMMPLSSSASSISQQPPSNQSSMSIQPPTASFVEEQHLEQYHHARQNNNPNQARYRMEGIMYRKHLLERADKKAQHRNWRQLLVVLDQGGLSMFRADGQLGQAFEEQGILFDEIRLQHTITNILPPPGYSSSRRHVFAIQLYTGAVFLFQTTTAQEAEDWARTCNYWAARTSKEPLVGGVINMDYGWGRSLDILNQSPSTDSGIGHSNTMTSTHSGYSLSEGGNSSGSLVTPPATSSGLAEDEEAKSGQHSTPNSTSSSGSGPNFLNYPHTNSGSSSSGVGYSGYGNGGVSSGGGRTASIKSTTKSSGSNVPLGDRVLLFEWTAPLPTMSMTQVTEQEQCASLKKYVSGLETEMEQHQEYRVPMTKLFLPKSQNYAKAFNNWERRSRYLLKEMVKYQIYVEALEQSLEVQRREAQAEADEAAIAVAQAELSEARAQPVVLPLVVELVVVEEDGKSLNEDLEHLQVDDDEDDEEFEDQVV
ncbi:MAG: hypothetical protein BYD32DRAFT_441774 [Podila humilis]|nr:MAG: hypothetical protein BYD32DRAFT_441774 [Podila humilis]